MKDLTNYPFKLLKLTLVAFAVLFIAGIVVLKLGSMVMGIVLISCGIFAIIVMLTVFWRCPKCDEMLPLGAMKTRKCPYCGEKID